MTETAELTIPEGLESKYNDIMGGPKLPDMKDGAFSDKEETQGDAYLEKLTKKDKGTQEKQEETEPEEEGVQEEKELSEPAGKEDETTEPIPDGLVKAGRAYGLTDETIIDLAETHPEALEAMQRSYERLQASSILAERPVQAVAKEPEAPKFMEHVSVDVSNLDEDASKTVKSMELTVNKIIDSNNDLRKELFAVRGGLQNTQVAEQSRRVSYIDGLFDKVAEFPELGKSGALETSQKNLRGDIYDVAIKWQKRSGGTFESNLGKAAEGFRTLYGHQLSGKDKERSILEKLNKRKTKFTARPTSQKTTQKFKSGDEKVMSVLEETGRKLDLW